MPDNMTVKRFKPVASAAISLSENGDYVLCGISWGMVR